MKRKLKLSVTKIRRQTIIWEKSASLFCPECERETEMLTFAESAAILEIESPVLDELLAAGKIHLIKAVNGKLRVCKNSLFCGDFSVDAK